MLNFDLTFQYTLLVDRNMRYPNRPPNFEAETFYGRLLNLYEIQFPAAPELRHPRPTVLVLARIQPCPITQGAIPNTISYQPRAHENAPLEVVDAGIISAVVGRMTYAGRTYIIDRTDGSLDVAIPSSE